MDIRAARISCESNGTIFAENATITNNAQSGIFVVFGGVVQARKATIGKNGTYGVYVNGSGFVDIADATVDDTNIGVTEQIIRCFGSGHIVAGAPGTVGFSSLMLKNYFPGYNQVGAGNAPILVTNFLLLRRGRGGQKYARRTR